MNMKKLKQFFNHSYVSGSIFTIAGFIIAGFLNKKYEWLTVKEILGYIKTVFIYKINMPPLLVNFSLIINIICIVIIIIILLRNINLLFLRKESQSKLSRQILNDILKQNIYSIDIGKRISSVNRKEQNYIINNIFNNLGKKEFAYSITKFCNVARGLLRKRIVLNKLIENLIAVGDVYSLGKFLNAIDEKRLKNCNQKKRNNFIEAIIKNLERMVYKEVDKIIPSVDKLNNFIPNTLVESYIDSLFEIAHSREYNKDNADDSLFELPDKLIKKSFSLFTIEYLCDIGSARLKMVRKYIEYNKHLWCKRDKCIFRSKTAT